MTQKRNALCINPPASIKELRALWILKRNLSFKSRKMTAWGLLVSKLLYAIEVWGPASTEKRLNQMQALQNTIMRWVCDARRGTRTRDLLRMTGMLSVRQLLMYRVLMVGLVGLWNNSPRHMSDWNEETQRRLKTTKRSPRFFFAKMLSQIPHSLLVREPHKNKAEIKKWIVNNIPYDEKWKGLEDLEQDSQGSDDIDG